MKKDNKVIIAQEKTKVKGHTDKISHSFSYM